MSRRIAPWLVLWALVSGSAACSLLVNEPEGLVRCTVDGDGKDPCPDDTRCIEGRCRGESEDGGNGGRDGQDCVPQEEICNGIDDDCDGEIDEGHDADGDGYTWCGGGKMEEADCDDNDSTIHPGADEVCDGRDNDCDGEYDEDTDGNLCPEGLACFEQRCAKPSCLVDGSSVVCPEGTRCDPSGECVKGSGCTEESCGASEVCDEQSGSCIAVARPNGKPCTSHDECASGVCIDAAALTYVGDAKRICGKACCSDEDCDDEEFCFASGTGARSCLPRSMDPRGDDSRNTCTAVSGCNELERCTMRDDMTIEGPLFGRRTGLESAVCGQPVGVEPPRAFCTSDRDCESGICELPYCSEACGASSECRVLFGSRSYYCRTKTTGFLSGDYASTCVFGRGEVGPGLQGEDCTTPDECAEALCVVPAGAEKGFCASACCNDSQCLEGNHCRAVAVGLHYEMRCVP